MTTIAGMGGYNPYLLSHYKSVSASGPSSSTNSSNAATSDSQTTPSTSLLAPVSMSSLPSIQMSPDMLAALQSGSVLQAPDAARTAEQNSTPAYAVVTNANTGQILGGVFPGAAVVSKINTAIDNRITGNNDWGQVTQYLAQDISQATGQNVTIQYYQLDDPNAPTFGSFMGTT